MTAIELISNAYYLSGVVSRQLESVDSSQLSDGLEMLNDILAEKSAKGYEIPYYNPEYQTQTVQGQEKYFIPGLIEEEAVTYNIGDVRYSAMRVNRKRYFGSSRANNISSLPATYHIERAKGGANLYFYYSPSDVYQVHITGKFSLQSVTSTSDISDALEGFYISYLKYALAKRICDFYDFDFSMEKKKTLGDLEKNIFQVSTPDMRIKKDSIFDDDNVGVNYAYANLGSGFILP